MKMEDVIKAYITLRNEKDAIEGEVKEKVRTKEKMVKLEAYIKKQADEQGVTSFKTGHGTAFVTTTDFAQVADWDAILNFIKKNEAWDMLEKRVSKNAVRGYIDEHKDVPSGVNYGTRIDINVRKPTAKVE
jgi:Cft2 family RNA processing exonuclease